MSLFSRIIDAGSAAVRAFARAPSASSAPAVIEAARASERTREIATPSPYHDRDAAMLGNALTPQVLTDILRRRNQGELQLWHDLADGFREKNPHMHSQLALREQSVVETEFEVTAGKGSNQRAAKRAADACNELLEAWTRMDASSAGEEHNNLLRWLAEFVSSHYYACGAHEIMWERTGGETLPTSLVWVDPRRLAYACDVGEPDPWKLRLWDQNSQGPFDQQYGVPVESFHPDKFLVHRPRVRGSQPTREGLFAILVWWCLFYTWDWRDLMSLIEMMGRPPIVGYFGAGGAKADSALTSAGGKFNGDRAATPEEVNALYAAIRQVNGALRAVLADTTRIEAVKLPLVGDNPIQLKTIEVIDRLVSKAINGVDSVSDLKPGARAAVESQERTSLTFWRSDCRYSAARLSWLFARYIRANPDRFGYECPLPVVTAHTDEPDYMAVLERVTKARAAGLLVPRAWAHEHTGVPEPLEVKGVLEPTLGPASAPTQTPQDPERQAPPQTTPENRQ